MNFRKKRIRKQEKFWGEILWGMTDFNGSLRIISLYKTKNKEARSDFLYRDSIKAPWEKIELKEEDTHYCFTADGQGLYVSTYKQPTVKKLDKYTGETKALYIYDIRQNK